MKNWLKILKFTLKQAVKGKKFIASTVLIGIVILIVAAGSNILISGILNKEIQVSDLQDVYIVNETDLTIDTDSFIKKHQKDYPLLKITDLEGVSAKDAASDPSIYAQNSSYSIVLEIKEDEESCNLTVYIPEESNMGSGDSDDFAKDFVEAVHNAKIASTDISEDELNMAISDIKITKVLAEESEEAKDNNLLAYVAPMGVMMLLYLLVIFYGQSIGQIISMEKTSKLMEYILTLTGPTGLIFGKVTAIFCEAVTQLLVWLVCGLGGVAIGSVISSKLIGGNGTNLIALFVEMLPEDGVSNNIVVLIILTLLALLAAFLFYCFVSALFASFAATAEELAQTNGLSIMTMLVGFLVSIYVPLFTDNSKIGLTIIRIIPFTSAFVLPGDVVCARISLIEFIIYFALLLFFTIMLAVLTGRVYKNRLFKRGTKGIFAEILSAITGKVSTKDSDEDALTTSSENGKALTVTDYEKIDKAKKSYTVVGFALLTLILGANALGTLVGNVIANLMAANSNQDLMSVYSDTSFLVINNCVAMYLVACPLCALVMKFTNDSVVKVKGHITKNQYLRSIFMMFPIDIGLSKLSEFLASALSGGEAENAIATNFLNGDNILAMIMVSVFAPVFEELIFRKLIIDRTRRYGELVAILYSAVAFGIFHCNIYQLFYAFALGLILGYVYVRTGNVILTIIMHMVVNSSSSVLYPLSPTVYEYFIYAMLVLGIGSIIYTLIKRDITFEKTKDSVAFKDLSGVAFRNSGTILFALAGIMIMLYSLFAPVLMK